MCVWHALNREMEIEGATIGLEEAMTMGELRKLTVMWNIHT